MLSSHFKKFRFYGFSSRSQQGLISLIVTLIILAIALITGINISLLGISEAKMGFQKEESLQAYYLTNLCAEYALMALKDDNSYSGDEVINVETGSCQIFPIEGNWIVKVLGTVSNQIRKIKIEINQINPEMIINSWEEVTEF